MNNLARIDNHEVQIAPLNADIFIKAFKKRHALSIEAFASSWRTYEPAIRSFLKWFGVFRAENVFDEAAFPLNGYVVAEYVKARTSHEHNSLNLTASTVEKHVAALMFVHKRLSSAEVERTPIEEALKSLKSQRTRKRGRGQAKALTRAHIEALIASIPTDLKGLRDRAIILLGWNGALRRSEIAGLDAVEASETELAAMTETERKRYIGHIERRSDGIVVNLQWSKTDQTGLGQSVSLPHAPSLPTCAVCAVQDWIAASGIEFGPLFRGMDKHGNLRNRRLSDHAVNLVIKQRIAEFVERLAPRDELNEIERDFVVNLDRFSAHSLRAGFCTQAGQDGISIQASMTHSRHKDYTTHLGYVQQSASMKDSAVAKMNEIALEGRDSP